MVSVLEALRGGKRFMKSPAAKIVSITCALLAAVIGSILIANSSPLALQKCEAGGANKFS
jgi:hypothetical protein